MIGAGSMPKNETTIVPLSFAQQRLWVVEQFLGDVRPYNARRAFRISGPLDVAALELSLDAIVQRHEVLRTTYRTDNGEPVGVVLPSMDARLRVIDLEDAGPFDVELRQQIAAESARAFDLARGPLVRATLFRIGRLEYVLLLVLHHAVWDGGSTRAFNAELEAGYGAVRSGHELHLPHLCVQYADFARRQRDAPESELEPQLASWRACLAGAPTMTGLPADRERPAEMSFRGAALTRLLGRELADRTRALSQASGASLFMVLLAAFAALLYRYTGERDMVIGTPFGGRARPEFEELIGFFVTTLPLRVAVSPQASFGELLTTVRNVALDAYDNQDVPFERLVAEFATGRSLAVTPLFNVMFLVQSEGELGADLALDDLVTTPFPLESTSTKFDLTFRVTERSDGLLCSMQYATDLFDGDRIERMLRHFENLLHGALASPEAAIAALPMLDPSERRRVVSDWNDTEVAGEVGWSVYGAFLRRAEMNPRAIAVQDGTGSLSAADLAVRSQAVAARLRHSGVVRGDIVGIVAESKLDTVTALLGILGAGAIFAPFDPSIPSERLAFMMADAAPRLVLADTPFVALVAPHVDKVEEIGSFVRGAAALSWIPELPRLEDAAYLIYTSGSTGRPKGVLVPHRALANLLQWSERTFPLGANDAVLQSTSYSFDPSIWETFWPLVADARLVLPDRHDRREPIKLIETVVGRRITVLEVVPTLLRALLQEPEFDRCVSLRHVFCGGEALTTDLVAAFRSRLGAQLHNVYGPAETAIWVTEWSCAPGWLGSTVPIGRPITNARCYVLDENKEPVPAGVPGELYIGGPQVSLGYLRHPELTAQRFLPDPFSEAGTVYRTGDRVRYGSDGNLYYHGRFDRQMKLRGVRIEPGEVEEALREQPGVSDAALALQQTASEAQRLVAYVVADGKLPDESVLRRALAARLPDAMIPSAFVAVDAIPLTPAGKVDFAALPAAAQVGGNGVHVAPRTTSEQQVAQVWAEVLDCPAIDREANFFESGGHSLFGIQVLSRLRQLTGASLSLRDLFETPTIAGLAGRVDGAVANSPATIRTLRRPWEVEP